MPRKPEILRRFGVTLRTNVVGSAVSFLASVIIARTLGSARFGDFTFLMASFLAVNTWLELGSPTAFYTFLSKGEDGRRHCMAFLGWMAARFAAVCFVVVILPQAWLDRIWLGHSRGLVLLALASYFMSTPLRAFLVQIAESARETLFIQTALAVFAVSHFALVALLARAGLLTVVSLFVLLIIEYGLLAAYFGLRFDWGQMPPDATRRSWKSLLAQYAAYCSPFIIYCCVNFPCEFADRWLLQRFGGSVQQGLFAFSQQFSSMALLATSSMLNIFWKEIAAAAHTGDTARVRDLYHNSSRLLFFLAAGAGCFLIPHSRTLILLLVGPDFESAWPALAMMFFYPMFQTLGQLNGALFYATEDIKMHVTIVSTAMLIGLPMTYFALAPATAAVPGLDLGANGFAARNALWVAGTISIQSWMIARRLGTANDNLHHLWVLLGLTALGWACHAWATALMGLVGYPTGWSILALAAPVYAAVVGAIVWTWPEHAGTSRDQLRRLLRWREVVA